MFVDAGGQTNHIYGGAYFENKKGLKASHGEKEQGSLVARPSRSEPLKNRHLKVTPPPPQHELSKPTIYLRNKGEGAHTQPKC